MICTEIESELRLKTFEQRYVEAPSTCICVVARGEWYEHLHCPGRLEHYFLDHGLGFYDREADEHVFVSQPYVNEKHHTVEEVTREAQAFAEENGLSIRVSADDSWHYPGWTIKIEFRKKEERYELQGMAG